MSSSRTVLLINPNTSSTTTALMLEAARPHAPPRIRLVGATAAIGASMITDEAALPTAAAEVLRLGTAAPGPAAIVVAAVADPGAAQLRATLSIPVIGIGESALREAAAKGRFGIATTTPLLRASIEAAIAHHGLATSYTGLRLTTADPITLAANPAAQTDALLRAATLCLERDGADTVIIGGGPLAASAATLAPTLGPCLVAPLPAAMRALWRTICLSPPQ